MYFTHVPRTLVFRPLEQLNRTDGHYYRHVESGRIYPSITTVLKIETKDAIQHWIDNIGILEAERIMKESQEAGTAMHTLVEKFLDNRPEPVFNITEFAKNPYELFEYIKPALADINNIHALETKLYSDELGLAGTVDCIAEYEGKLSVIDFKNSRKRKTKSRVKNYFLQACAYGQMAKQCLDLNIEQGVIIISNWDGTNSIFKINLADYEEPLLKVLLKWETLDL